MQLTGVRVQDGEMRRNPFRPGAYGRVFSDGEWIWYACSPNGHLGNLAAHDVVEHENGTISVDPSILITGGPDMKTELWHGYLSQGVWQQC